jgi:hypothetical protein
MNIFSHSSCCESMSTYSPQRSIPNSMPTSMPFSPASQLGVNFRSHFPSSTPILKSPKNHHNASPHNSNGNHHMVRDLEAPDWASTANYSIGSDYYHDMASATSRNAQQNNIMSTLFDNNSDELLSLAREEETISPAKKPALLDDREVAVASALFGEKMNGFEDDNMAMQMQDNVAMTEPHQTMQDDSLPTTNAPANSATTTTIIIPAVSAEIVMSTTDSPRC